MRWVLLLRLGDIHINFWRGKLNNGDRIKVSEPVEALSYNTQAYLFLMWMHRWLLIPWFWFKYSLLGYLQSKGRKRKKYSAGNGMVGINSSIHSENQDFSIIIYFRGSYGLVWGNIETLSDPSCKPSRGSLLTIN